MGLLLRILFVIPFGFVAASVAAGLFFVFAGIGIGPGGAYLDRYLLDTIVLVAGVSAAAGGYATAPALAAIVVAEIFRLRSAFYYLLAGGGIGLGIEMAAGAPEAGPTFAEFRLFLASGVVGGFVYWLIAGRGAGGGATPAIAQRDERP